MEEENPYRAPEPAVEEMVWIDPETSEGNPSREELRAFLGPRADSYLSNWRGELNGTGAGTGFNWPSFLFSGFWLPYRKMYRTTLIFYGVIWFESIIEDIVCLGVLKMPETSGGFGALVGLVAAVVCGILGNRWYLDHARRSIAEIRARGLDKEAYLGALARRGGTSIGAGLGFFLLYIVLSIATTTVVEAFLAPG